ncbi:thioesterase domain-containing protein, partial [Paludibacterium sp.]|uniref:thioesterase domain-containing protein n=1 Tax=Paludibacterium sp. TaxID=1917523 RepID=UPI0025E080AC
RRPGVARVTLAPKDGDYDNELSRFRYDVTLRVGEAETLAAPDTVLTWDDGDDPLARLEAELAAQPGVCIALDTVPDRRVTPFTRAWQTLQTGAARTVADLALAADGVTPSALFAMARRYGATLAWQPQGLGDRYRVLFNPSWQAAPSRGGQPAPHPGHANTPARLGADTALTQALNAALKQRLPDYMLPSAILVLPALPLTANGKLDQAALPDPVRTAQAYAPPRTPREHLLCQLFAEMLTLPRVGIDDDFFALGGHSLTAARLIGKIGTALGARLSIRALFEAPTVRALALRLSQREGDGDAFDVLLPLRARGRLTPLFCIHPVGGLAWAYAGLLHGLDDERPLYGIQARGILTAEYAAPDIATLARDYVRVARALQPQGPYLLLGWSFGGLIAHEMARQLQAEGDEVGLLAMMDAYPMRPGDRLPEWDERAVLAGFAQALGIALTPAEAAGLSMAVFVAAARRAGHVLGCLDDSQAQRFLALLADFRRLIPAFRPGKVDGDMLFFQALRPEALGIERADGITPHVWQPHVGGRLHLRALDCAHTEMANPDPIRQIARDLEQFLRETAPLQARQPGETPMER